MKRSFAVLSLSLASLLAYTQIEAHPLPHNHESILAPVVHSMLEMKYIFIPWVVFLIFKLGKPILNRFK
jgi:hypothetical protein